MKYSIKVIPVMWITIVLPERTTNIFGPLWQGLNFTSLIDTFYLNSLAGTSLFSLFLILSNRCLIDSNCSNLCLSDNISFSSNAFTNLRISSKASKDIWFAQINTISLAIVLFQFKKFVSNFSMLVGFPLGERSITPTSVPVRVENSVAFLN